MCFAYSVTTFCCLSWVLHSYERKKLRERYSLPPDPECEDSLTTFCCGLCALCQEAREIKLRGKSTNLHLIDKPLGFCLEEEAAVAYEAGGDEPVVSQPRAKSGNPAQLNESYESEEQSEQYESTGVSERV